MTTYELAKTLTQAQREAMSQAGILSPNLTRYMFIYEMWMSLIEEGKTKTEAYYEIGQRCFTCEENVRKIVYRMQKEVAGKKVSHDNSEV